MRTLHIDWADLELALRDATGAKSYVDCETGEVVVVVDGFDDAREVEEKIRRNPARYAQVHPLDLEFSKWVLHGFVQQMKPGLLQQALGDEEGRPGGFARCMSILREDKAAYGAFARFEQNEVLRVAEDFLKNHDLRSDESPPSIELFEGMMSVEDVKV